MKVNRSQLMAIVLIFALVSNTIVHFVHPAYREYLRCSTDLKSEVDDFRSEVLHRFTPIVSNLVQLVVKASPSSIVVDRVGITTNLPTVVGKSIVDSVALSYAECGSEKYVVVNGILPLCVGQSLYGERILSIDKTSVETEGRIYLFSPSVPRVGKEGLITNRGDKVK